MARLGFFLLVLSFPILFVAAMAVSSSPTDFIVASCKTTRYPPLCVQSLSGYADEIQQSDHQLAQTALKVSLAKANSTSAYVAKMAKVQGIKPREYQAVRDCINTMADSVDRLNQAMNELGHMGQAVGQDFMWHMSNVQTWTSAALTDENTCLDCFAGRQMDGNIKNSIRRGIVDVAQVTSNALALVNRFAERHQSAGPAKNP
ncbi:hypothetical protein SLE2022_089260 [Rubroshorea leprosula]